MPSDTHIFGRFLSEQSHRNYGYVDEETTPRSLAAAKKNSLRKLSAQLQQKIDRTEQEAQQVGDLLEKPIFTRVTSFAEDGIDLAVHSSISSHTIINMGLTAHRNIKVGSQRF
jgi:ribosomal protein L9